MYRNFVLNKETDDDWQNAFFRDDLCVLIEEKFGALSQGTVQQIEAMDDPERLRSLIRQVHRANSLEELGLQ